MHGATKCPAPALPGAAAIGHVLVLRSAVSWLVDVDVKTITGQDDNIYVVDMVKLLVMKTLSFESVLAQANTSFITTNLKFAFQEMSQ